MWKIVPGSKDFLTSLYITANLGSAASVKTNPATFRSFEAVPELLHSFSGFLKVYKYSRVHQSGVDHVSCKSSGSDGIQTVGLTKAHEPGRRGTRDASHQIGKRLAAFCCSVYLACCPPPHQCVITPARLLLQIFQHRSGSTQKDIFELSMRMMS